MFKGERTFTLIPQANGSVVFDMYEVFTGLLAPPHTFDVFVVALKDAAEKG